MDTLISVLLYMNVIASNGHYTVSDINNFATVYSAQINAIEINLPQLEAVLAQEEPMAIWVMDGLGG